MSTKKKEKIVEIKFSVRTCVLIILVALVFFFAISKLSIKKCPKDCNDNNVCTLDYCSESTNFNCMYEEIENCCNYNDNCTSNMCYKNQCVDDNDLTKVKKDYFEDLNENKILKYNVNDWDVEKSYDKIVIYSTILEVEDDINQIQATLQHIASEQIAKSNNNNWSIVYVFAWNKPSYLGNCMFNVGKMEWRGKKNVKYYYTTKDKRGKYPDGCIYVDMY